MTDPPLVWIVGCIDSNGAIEAKEVRLGDHLWMHSVETSRGHKWRWSVREQMFTLPRGNSELTDEENFLVHDWLVKNGYAS